MGGGNGAKAQQKRERNAKKAGKAASTPAQRAMPGFICKTHRNKSYMTTQATDMKKHMLEEHPGQTQEQVFEPCDLK